VVAERRDGRYERAAARFAARLTEKPNVKMLAYDGQADGGTRTPDPIITSDVLYQLSYVGEVG
jgi:hypothetical protein